MTDTRKPTAVPAAPSAPTAGPPDDAYHPDAVEAKWQARWAERRTNEPDLDAGRAAVLQPHDVPLPVGRGAARGEHVRLHRQPTSTAGSSGCRGYDVFEPIGFDAFGIHSENYAIKRGHQPRRS